MSFEEGGWDRPAGPDPRGASGPPGQLRPEYRQPASGPVSRWGGATGNERLTAMTGAVLLILLLVEGFTILRLGRLLTLHFFLGMLLLGPVTLKAGSTVYRFGRYYTGHPEYRRKGPPAPLLRLLGPLIVLLTAGVFGTGVLLAVLGPGNYTLVHLHKLSFIAWFCVVAVHVLWYVPRLPRLLAAEARGVGDPEDGAYAGPYAGPGRHAKRAAAALGGRGVRLALLIASLLCGLVIALLTVHLEGAWR